MENAKKQYDVDKLKAEKEVIIQQNVEQLDSIKEILGNL